MCNTPSSIDLRQYVKLIHSQGNIGACTACAALCAIELMSARANKFQYLSRLYVYYMTRKLNNRVGQTGASLKDTFTAISKYGVPPENMWPYKQSLQNIEPLVHVMDSALLNKNIDYTTISNNVETFKNYLQGGLPIIIGFATGILFWKLHGRLASQKYMPVNSTNNIQSKGHAATIVGYDDTLCGGSFIIANSSGPRWGDCGFGIFPYMCIVDVGEAYVIAKFGVISTS